MSRPRIGVIVFPGSNCDQDCVDAVRAMGAEPVMLWHRDSDLQGVKALLLPGGFSYGDYLRAGALARFSPIVQQVIEFAAQGRPVLGICNGFQVLTEAGLLPGALVRNRTLRFLCERVTVTVENTATPFTRLLTAGESLMLPIAHAEGNYIADAETLKALEDAGQVVFRYATDVNGACNRIAGVCNTAGNVVGMMPHPERNLRVGHLWSGEGQRVFEALQQAVS